MLRTKMITLQFGKMYQGYALVMYVTRFDLPHELQRNHTHPPFGWVSAAWEGPDTQHSATNTMAFFVAYDDKQVSQLSNISSIR